MKKKYIFRVSLFLNAGFVALLLVMIFTGSYGRPIVHHVSHNFSGRTSLFSVLPRRPGAVVFIGDSMTARCEWSEILENPAVINRGIDADSTDGVLKRLGGITGMKPDKIFLMIGINDIAIGIDPSRVVNNYRLIIETIRKESPGTKLYVQSIIPINKYRVDVPPDRIERVNESLRDLSRRYGITFLDIASLVKDKGGRLREDLTYDGVHLTGEGYLIWKKVVEKYIP